MQQGRLITPAGSSARESLTEARRLDPTDPTVAQGVRELSGLLAEEARKSLAAGKSDEATGYVSAARQLGSAGAALAAVERAIADAGKPAPTAAPAGQSSARRATPSSGPDDLVAEVRQRISEGKLIDPAGGSAKDALLELRTAAPTRPEVEELSRALSTRLIDISKQAMVAKAFERSAQLLTASREVGARYNEAAIAQAEQELRATRDQTALQTNIVSTASLKRTRMVNPVYPESARKRGIEGWVELTFTVQPNGAVDEVAVRNASPATVFDDAAIRAIRQWRFEPIVRNGERVPQRAMVRLKFSQQE
jgi:TonB family protein